MYFTVHYFVNKTKNHLKKTKFDRTKKTYSLYHEDFGIFSYLIHAKHLFVPKWYLTICYCHFSIGFVHCYLLNHYRNWQQGMDR